jgi:general secretion pathway protein C
MLMTNTTENGFLRQSGAVQTILLTKVVLAAFLLVWLLFSVVQLANSLGLLSHQADRATQTPSESLAVDHQKPSALPEVNLETLASIALFGEVVEVAEVVAVLPKEEVIVETKLNLTLKGLFASEGEKLGRAIIANGREERLYKVGEAIEGLSRVKLLDVFFDRVKLDNQGTAEVLYLYTEGERLTSALDGENRLSSFVEQASEVASAQISALPQPQSRKGKKLNQIMRVVHERDKSTGEMLGFRVLPGRDREAFERSGLKVNDVITSIDGESLTDLRSAMNIYRSKRDVAHVSLVIRRSDNEISLDINLSKLNI